LRSKFVFLVITIALFLASCSTKDDKEKRSSPNVVFIVVDDLRPQLNCYGSAEIKSPFIDQLSANTNMYLNAVANAPVCGASRASFLTGLRPSNNRFKSYDSRIDQDAPNVPTIGAWFKRNGYYTISNGKTTHEKLDAPESWSEPAWKAEEDWRDYQTIANKLIAKDNNGIAKSHEIGDSLLDTYADIKLITKSIADLKRMQNENQPFFIAVGIQKPHLPFNAPKKYWNMYLEKEILLADNRCQPKNSPKISMHNYGELRKYIDIPSNKNTALADSIQRKLKHGYFSCVSYIDNEIGRLISALKKMSLYKNTVIVLVGDHGWQLGEHNLWAKHCNYQTSLKVPLLIKAANQKQQQKVNAVVELIDLYPTLCELCGISKPKHLQGKSLVNLRTKNSNSTAFSKYKKGTTITTNAYSYTKWIAKKSKQQLGHMLYDLKNDPNENLSLINDSSYKETINYYSKKLDSIQNL